MSAILGSSSSSSVGGGGGGSGETTPAGALLDVPDVEGLIEEKNQLISRQYAEIERLQRELAEVVGERDALLCEVSKFKFEREMTDLKRLHDDRYARPFFSFFTLAPLARTSSYTRSRRSRRTRERRWKREIARFLECTCSFFPLRFLLPPDLFFPFATPRFSLKRGKCNARHSPRGTGGLTAVKIHFYRRESALLFYVLYIFIMLVIIAAPAHLRPASLLRLNGAKTARGFGTGQKVQKIETWKNSRKRGIYAFQTHFSRLKLDEAVQRVQPNTTDTHIFF